MPPEGLGEVELPFPIAEETIAFEVVGDSMLPKYENGDIIVVYRDQRHPLTSFYGEEAAVRLEERRALSEDDRAQQDRPCRQPHELQRQADIRRQAGMDRGNLRDLAQGPVERLRARAAGRSRRKSPGTGSRDGKPPKSISSFRGDAQHEPGIPSEIIGPPGTNGFRGLTYGSPRNDGHF